MSNEANGSGFFVSALQIAFIVLKLTHVIDWPWWLVLSPLWIGFSLAILIIVIFVIIKLLVD